VEDKCFKGLFKNKPLLKMKQKFIWNNFYLQWLIAIPIKLCIET